MRKFILLLLVLVLSSVSVCNASDNYYVSTATGNDACSAALAKDPCNPWATIANALTKASADSNDYILNVAAGTYAESAYTIGSTKDGKTIVIQGATSDANDTIFSSTSAQAFTISSLTTGNITWRNMTIKSTYASNRTIINMGAYDGSQLTFDNCIIGVPDDATTGWTRCIYYADTAVSPPTRKLTLIDSYCYGKDNNYTVYLVDINTLTINHTLIDRTNADYSGSWAAIYLNEAIGTVTINNGSVIKGTVYGLLMGSATSSFAKCEIDNVTFDCNNQAIQILDYLQEGIFTNITANNGIFLGHVYEASVSPLGSIVVRDCNLVHTSPDVTAGVFGLVIGYGVTGAEVSYNNILDFDIALALKGTACHIHHNIFKGGSNSADDKHCVYIRSASNCLFNHNIIYALGNCALILYDQVGFPPDPDTDYNTFVNNIFDASGGGKYAIYLRGPKVHHNLFDYNCYVAGSKALALGRYYDPVIRSLYGLQMWWMFNGGSEESRTNDSHSIDTDPQFMDAANSDFRLKPTSPCLNTGERTLDGGYTSMGAWQPPIFTTSGYVLDLDGSTAVEGVLIQTDDNDINSVTDANGYYKLSIGYGWSGIVTPQKEGYVFEPDSNTYTNVIEDYSDQNYIATLMTFKIAGYVLEQNYATPINDVNVSAENGGGTWTSRYGGGSWPTDANGYYEVVVDYNWSGKVTPTKYTYVFTPANTDYNNVIADRNNQNYNGKSLPFAISGYIKNGCNVPMAGVLVEANNGGGQDTTDVNGFYKVWVGYNWFGTVTPTKEHHTFNPGEMVYVDVLADQTEQNYQAANIYDLDYDCSIGFGDIRIISENWLDGPDIPGDFYKDEDNIVNFLDFAEFAEHWLE